MASKGEERRRLLLEAALELFSTRGFEGTTTRAVAEKAGVTEPALFRYFRSKQELYEAVIAEHGPQEVFAGPFAAHRRQPLEEVLRLSIARYLDGVWEHRGVVRMMIMGQLSSQDTTKEAPRDQGREYLELLLEQRAARGEIRAAVTPAAGSVISGAVGGFLLRMFLHEPTDWALARDEFVEQLVDVTLRGIEPRCTNPPETLGAVMPEAAWPQDLPPRTQRFAEEKPDKR